MINRNNQEAPSSANIEVIHPGVLILLQVIVVRNQRLSAEEGGDVLGEQLINTCLHQCVCNSDYCNNKLTVLL